MRFNLLNFLTNSQKEILCGFWVNGRFRELAGIFLQARSNFFLKANLSQKFYFHFFERKDASWVYFIHCVKNKIFSFLSFALIPFSLRPYQVSLNFKEGGSWQRNLDSFFFQGREVKTQKSAVSDFLILKAFLILKE